MTARTVHLCGTGPPAVRGLRCDVTPWLCPLCDGTGRSTEDGGRCYMCAGSCLVGDEQLGGWDRATITPAPRPPAVMPSPCIDCAYRPGSPEDDPAAGRPDTATTPFFCHHGMHRVDGPGGAGYVPAASTVGGLPLGYMVCAGWWTSVVLGQAAPDRPFRDPGGSDRTPAAGP